MIPFLHRLHAANKPPEDNPLWLVVLADMMTNLMLFFLVMYAMTISSPQARAQMARSFDAKAVVAEPPAEPAPPRDAFKEEVYAPVKGLFDDAVLEERLVRVRLRDRLLFPTALADLSPEAAEPLERLARLLASMPNAVVVEGHTDDVPLAVSPYKSNWELSVARSYSVIERLAGHGVAPARLVAAGYGEHRPLVPNNDAESRARNRRVEILILRDAVTAHE
ncbi:MAG: flagellar motor protein MotB [Elusimicrobiota bacterium]|nr:flagellar motor protein MotB [Elusimicrobiota bacterium]